MDYIPKPAPKTRRRKKRNPNLMYSYTISKPSATNQKYYLGEIWFGTTSNALPPYWNTCVADFPYNRDTLILRFDTTTLFRISLNIETDFLQTLISAKTFSMEFKLVGENVMASLFMNAIPLLRFNSKIGFVVKRLFSINFDIACDYNEIESIRNSTVIESITDLYTNISRYREGVDEIDVQHAHLKPRLRKYQQDAVRWMIQREKESPQNEILHPLYEEVTLKSGVKVYYDKYMGYLDLTKPTTASLQTGGILADEMGLGKTVEVLACILSHPCDGEPLVKLDEHITWPVIDKQSRKRQINHEKGDKSLEADQSPAKKSKVPEEWVRRSSRKSALRVALETWYNNELSVKAPPETPKVQCICGETDEGDCVKCEDCSKVQHGRCLGYRKTDGEFFCSQCWLNKPLLPCNATLIVTPQSLKQQWSDEILKHINGPFKVLLYEGGPNVVPVYPTRLQKYDVVITTYTVLQNELRLVENGQAIGLRRPPKYSLPGSSITRIKWWRLCLDEAQTVETPGRMVSEMARRINAQHRWAVTGTPISKDITDLYGLINYLQISPYCESDTWDNLLYKPYINGRMEVMHQFLAKIMWRTAKVDVIDQINIPQQTFTEHWLNFSAVEKFYYQREHELCSTEFLSRLRNVGSNMLLCALHKTVIKKIMQPLLALRQACCHHQAVKGKYLASHKHVTSMEDLLNALIAKNVSENEEYLRRIVSSLNGLAGIHLLMQLHDQAAEYYRTVLQLSTRFCTKESCLEIDKLQLIHTMHNLADILKIYPTIPPTLRDGALTEECQVLEKEYLQRFTKQTLLALENSSKFSKNIEQLQGKFKLNAGQWFADAIDWVTTQSLFDQFLSRMTETMHTANISLKDISERKVLYMIAVWDEDITRLKDAAVNSIHQLFEAQIEGEEPKIAIPVEVIEAAAACHLRQSRKPKQKEKCLLCNTNFYLKQYESKIFSTTQKEDDDMANAGSWKPAPQEFMLRALHALGKQKNLSPDILHDAEIHFHILDILKKEFKEIRKLWTYIDAQICAKDEVDMCKMRLRLRNPWEKRENERSKIDRMMRQLTHPQENPFATIHVLDRSELPYQKAMLQSEYQTNSAALEKNVGIYKYLQTLHEQQTTGETPDPCPICKNTLEKQWNILLCGHSYCVECTQGLIGQTMSKYITCSICRSKQLISDISFLHADTKKTENNGEDQVKIKGNHSTKIEAVVRLVKKLKEDEPGVKVLVFSHWTVVLKVLDNVFALNEVESQILQHQNFDRTLDEFKDKSRGITALLLPISLGGKGLNLIEATHVIFVEPLLNPGDELQAIGRIHRIGQTRPTVVHKFFIRNTIEENIQHATATEADEWDSNKVTVSHLKQLFQVDFTSSAEDENVVGES